MSLDSDLHWIGKLNSNSAFAVAADSKVGCFLEYVVDYIVEDKRIHNTIDVVVGNIGVAVVVLFVVDLDLAIR